MRLLPIQAGLDGDALERLGTQSATPDTEDLICSDCGYRTVCLQSPFREYCNGCSSVNCITYRKPVFDVECGVCLDYKQPPESSSEF